MVEEERPPKTGAPRAEGALPPFPASLHSFTNGTGAAWSPGIRPFIPPENNLAFGPGRTKASLKAKEEPGLKWTNVLQFLDS